MNASQIASPAERFSPPEACTQTNAQVNVAVSCPLQALTCYGLQNHAQHKELLQCPGLVNAILQHLALEPQLSDSQQAEASGKRLTAAQAEHAEAALEAAISLTISQGGLQV